MIFNSENITWVPEKSGGYFAVVDDSDAHDLIIDIGEISDFAAFTASFRNRPFFMHSKTGISVDEIPYETQFLMIKHSDGKYSVIIPLVENVTRCAIFGENGHLKATVETGDKNVHIKKARILYVTTGENLYKELEKTSKVLSENFGLKLKKDKKTPKIYNKFGWCTWNAFGIDISEDNLIEGLKSFKETGIEPRFLILDDGWQTVNDDFDNRGNFKLKSFVPNEKFNHTLKPVIEKAKNEYKIEDFYVWHAVMGYWGGIDVTSEEMKKYHPFLRDGAFSEYMDKNFYYECGTYGFAGKDFIYDFYNDYHKLLKSEGVDGVKIDTQYFPEAHADGQGGRVRLNKIIHEAMEKSTLENFSNELINCMSCSNDIFFSLKDSNIIRTSDDFIPEDDTSHGLHIYNNAINSIMYRDFSFCDWDMFQSGHKFGAYHAAARAVSGSPVYVTDEVGGHDKNVLKSLVMSDGYVPVPENTALPTLDSVFEDPFKEDVLFKIFNYNKNNGVIALFNMKTDSTITDKVSPSDIEGFNEGHYAVYSYKTGKKYNIGANDSIEITLKFGDFDILTFSKIENNFAPIGLIDFYNCGATFEYKDEIILKDNGRFLAYCKNKPEQILNNERLCEFEYKDEFIEVKAQKGKLKII